MQPSCRSCGCDDLRVVLSLGNSPLANRLLTREETTKAEPRYPLEVGFCPMCGLVQLLETVPPEQLFSDYPYFSSFSDTMLLHAKKLSEELVRSRRLASRHLVVEIASNDGYLLQFYRQQGVQVLGVEPARNVAAAAIERGIPTVTEFFGKEIAERLVSEGRTADVVHAHNVLAHVPDVDGFMEGVGLILKPEGVAVVEAPYVRDLIENVEFDTIYHEHVFYFSLRALTTLARRHGLDVVHVTRVPIHGGSLRVHLAHSGERLRPASSVERILTEERELGMDDAEYYLGFSRRVERLKDDLVEVLDRLKLDGKRIAAYGASAKGTTLLSYCGLGPKHLEYVVDRSTVKQGRFTPGSHLPIYSPEMLLNSMPDYLLLLVWNFKEEILAQQAEYRRRGGRFVVPVPKVEII